MTNANKVIARRLLDGSNEPLPLADWAAGRLWATDHVLVR
jgi:hypothetical protein